MKKNRKITLSREARVYAYTIVNIRYIKDNLKTNFNKNLFKSNKTTVLLTILIFIDNVKFPNDKVTNTQIEVVNLSNYLKLQSKFSKKQEFWFFLLWGQKYIAKKWVGEIWQSLFNLIFYFTFRTPCINSYAIKVSVYKKCYFFVSINFDRKTQIWQKHLDTGIDHNT